MGVRRPWREESSRGEKEIFMRSRVYSDLVRFGFCLLALGLCLGCAEKTPLMPLPEPPPPLAIGAQKSVLAEFPADGQWHPAGFMVVPGDIIAFVPAGEAKSIGKESVHVHIGRTLTQFAFAARAQVVTQPGAIAFRSVLENLGPYPAKTIQVEIRNLRKE